MDEAEKYKQRLEAIAEKRRLQEEQDKAKRELEDERLRQQQLKRKSLRDQWLMEGAPLSPTSPDSQNPLSSLLSTQDKEKYSKLQSENQRLPEEREKPEEQEAVKVEMTGAEKVKVVMQNGENNTTGSETSVKEEELIQRPPEAETAAVLTNGNVEANSNHSTSEQSELNPNGPLRATEGVDRIKPEPVMSVTESASGPNTNVNEEDEEEGTLVIRAEPVFITDDGEDVPEDLSYQEDQQESDNAPPPHPEAGSKTGEVMEEVVKTETLPESENREAAELTVEAQPTAGFKDVEGGIESKNNPDEETKAEGQGEKMEGPVCEQLQSPVSALEGAAMALVPVYTEASPSSLSPKTEAQIKDEALAAPEGERAALKVEDPTCQPGPFQEVPLSDPQEKQPGELEPLLVKVEASNLNAQSAGSNSRANAETQNPTKAGQGEETGSPKRKTCQCCSVM